MKKRASRVKRKCASCGLVFERLACQLSRGRGRYCSRACSAAGLKHGTELYCALCDSVFYRAVAEQDIGLKVNQFCSRDCYMQWRSVNRKAGSYPKVGGVHRHRIVAEEVLGRALRAGEVVHHIDLNKHNAHPTNLAVFPGQSEHMKCHMGSMSACELDAYRLISKGGA